MKNAEALRKLIEKLTNEAAEKFVPRYNVSPGQKSPVITRKGALAAVEMKWGPFYKINDSKPSLMVNARSETVAAKPTFKKTVQQRRCLIPADGFFEWKREGTTKLPYYFQANQGAPFLIAGIYEEADTNGNPPSYLLLTTQPNEVMSSIHDRMPVILDEDKARIWMEPGAMTESQVAALCVPYNASHMSKHRVSAVVNSSRNDVPECVVPVWDEGGTVEFKLE